MSQGTFNEYGKEEAISMLLKSGDFSARKDSGFEPEPGSKVCTASRIFMEGVDFDLTYFPLKHLGYKCAVAVTGELYASMAHPRTLSLRLGLSSKLDFGHVKDLWEGVALAAKEHGFKAVDLDLVPSPNGLAIAASAAGERLKTTSDKLPEAKSMDLVCVSGSLGAAYLGQQILEHGKQNFERNAVQPDLERYKMLVGSYLKPELDSTAVRHLEESAIYPSHGGLVSHGLSDAVKRLAADTGLGVKIYAEKIPFEGNSFAAGKEMDIDPISAAMNGGDDFRLLFTIPILEAENFRRDFQTFDIIGHLAKPEVGQVLVTPDGVELPVKAQGWNDDSDQVSRC